MDFQKSPYDSFIRDYAEICRTQMSAVWMSSQLEKALSVRDCFDARRIILTGSELGYAAAVAGLEAFRAACKGDIMFGIELITQAEFNYFNNVANMGIGEPNTPLVFVMGETQDDSDLQNTLCAAQKSGANPILICAQGDPDDSEHGKLFLGIEPQDPNYLPKAYIGLLLAVVSVGYRVGRVRGPVNESEVAQLARETDSYIEKCEKALPRICEAAWDFAERTKGMLCFNYIADADMAGSAHFLGTVGARTIGHQYEINDSEEWCHIAFWLLDRFHVATVLLACKSQNSFSRLVETMGSVYKLKRPYLLVTDANEAEFGEQVRCCRIPSPPNAFVWMASLINSLPALFAYGIKKDKI